MTHIDHNAPTEANEPVRLPARTLPRGVVVVVAIVVFVLTLLVVVGLAVLMSQFKR